jgi:surface carbohydrate biosynthesis protein
MRTRASLIIPVENQVRELDPKLLLACVAATAGFSSYIGSRLELDFRIASLPRSIYLSKSMTARSIKMFRIMRKLGHKIAVWDEEALVHMQAETYFNRRLAADAIKHVSILFAWGRENLDLWKQYPNLPGDLPIHITGNPRGDMLRPELRDYFADEVDALRKQHGDYILINSNFSNVNAFVPGLNLFFPEKTPGVEHKYARGAVGMSREFAEGLHNFKQAIFNDFKQMIPAIEHSFPNQTIIVRPHPTEDMSVYHDIAANCSRVKVINKGNVIPWLLASKALVHNSCTTGIEAFILGVPAISYMASRDEYYDEGYYRLPNKLSHQCFTFDELQTALGKVLAGELGAATGSERTKLVEYYLTALDGPLACRRITDVLAAVADSWAGSRVPPVSRRLEGWYLANRRRVAKWYKSFQSGSKYRPEFQRHRYPSLALDEIKNRVARIQRLLQAKENLKVTQISAHIFKIEQHE